MSGGQTEIPAPSGPADAPDGAILEQFVARAAALTDEQREAIAARRRAIDEHGHEAALRAGAETLVERPEAYASARRTLAAAHVPDALGREDLSEVERARWNDVARLVQLSIDEMLLALVGSEVLHPNHLRELSAAWGHRSDYPDPTTASTSSP